MSEAEALLAVQLEQAGIPFEREYRFAPEEWCIERGYVTPKRRQPKEWRADFRIDWSLIDRFWSGLLIEVEGGSWVNGRHTRGAGFEADVIKYNAAAELGFRLLRYTTGQVNDGTAIAQIRRIINVEDIAA